MRKKRLLGFVIDYGLLIIPFVTISVVSCSNVQTILQIFLIVIFMGRDSITGQSIGRKIVNICVLHNQHPIHPVRAFVRNLFIIIWPIELIMLLVADKRLGDILTKSEVVICPLVQRKISCRGIGLILIVGISLSILWLYYKTYSPLLNLLYE